MDNINGLRDRDKLTFSIRNEAMATQDNKLFQLDGYEVTTISMPAYWVEPSPSLLLFLSLLLLSSFSLLYLCCSSLFSISVSA